MRWVNQWDNLTGIIERGYGGASIFWDNSHAREDLSRVNDYGRMLAKGSAAGQRKALEGSYGADPDARSHGETFLNLLEKRLVPDGLYFLDFQ